MYKFRRKFSVLLIAMLLMLTITGCGGNNEATDGGNDEVATDEVAGDEATDESGDNDQASGEVVEAVGTLLEVTPIDGGKAELVFEVDGDEITLKADSSELYKFTIGSDYSFSHDGNEIMDFSRMEDEE